MKNLESFLHARLQGELARLFRTYAEDEPLQILLTTHNTAFVGVADEGLHAEMDDDGRTVLSMLPRQDIIRVAYTEGTTTYAHPLHIGPPKPLLIVEGEDDRDILLLAFKGSSLVNPFEILCLKDFDEKMSGGTQLVKWLRYNRDALEARPETSPVLVLVDWEVPETDAVSFKKLGQALDGHATSRCFAWPADLANPDLSPNWVGIERFLSTKFVDYMRTEHGLRVSAPVLPDQPGWSYTIDKKELTKKKSLMHHALDDRDDPGDVEPIVAALPWLCGQLKNAPPLL